MLSKSPRKITLALGLLAATAMGLQAANAAGDNPTQERQDLMKNVGAATKAGAAIAKGSAPFDINAAQLVLRTMNAAGIGFAYMFPEGSETGNDTEAAPAIWSDRAGFNAASAKFVKDTSANVTDLDSFKAAFGAAAANCGTCHKAYRVKK